MYKCIAAIGAALAALLVLAVALLMNGSAAPENDASAAAAPSSDAAPRSDFASNALSSADRAQLAARGSPLSEIERQLERFRTGFPPARLIRPTVVGDGIVLLVSSSVMLRFWCCSSVVTLFVFG